MTSTKRITIVIPTFNSVGKLARALESIERIDYPSDECEVIIIDDGSTDNTGDCVARMAGESRFNLRYVYQENRGPAAARNAGIRQAAGDYILIIDSDCYVDRGILTRYLAHYPDEGLGGVGGDVLPDSVNIIARYLDYIGAWRPGLSHGDIIYLVTANAFFLKQAIVDAGYFDEEFRLPGGEEPELCHRMRKKGYHFKYDKNAVVVHSHRTSIKMMAKMFITHGKGYAIFIRKWPDALPMRPWLRGSLSGREAYLRFTSDFVRNMKFHTALVFFFFEYLRVVAFALGYRSKMKDIDG